MFKGLHNSAELGATTIKTEVEYPEPQKIEEEKSQFGHLNEQMEIVPSAEIEEIVVKVEQAEEHVECIELDNGKRMKMEVIPGNGNGTGTEGENWKIVCHRCKEAYTLEQV